jgi:hypothetical protein
MVEEGTRVGHDVRRGGHAREFLGEGPALFGIGEDGARARGA